MRYSRQLAALLATVMTALIISAPGHAQSTPAPAIASSHATVHNAIIENVVLASAVKASGYNVVRGDTLSKIARAQCGKASAWQSIWHGNPQITNPNRIYPGQHLQLTCAHTTAAAAPVQKSSTPTSGVQSVISYALAQVGKRYVWNTAGPNSFDCSGLVLAAYARMGIKLPHQSGAIARLGRRVTSLQPGDLLFLSDRSGNVYHVIIYIGNNQIVEAAGVGIGVVKGSVYSYSFAERFV